MTIYHCQRQICDTCDTERDKYAFFGYHGATTCELCRFKLRRLAEKAEKLRERWRLKKQRQRVRQSSDSAAVTASKKAHQESLRMAREAGERSIALIRAAAQEDHSEPPWDDLDGDYEEDLDDDLEDNIY